MKNEFYDAYTELFQNSFNRLRRTIRIKVKAIKYCEKFDFSNHTAQKRIETQNKMKTKFFGTQLHEELKVHNKDNNIDIDGFVFDPILQDEVDEQSSLFYSSEESSESDSEIKSVLNSKDSIDLDEESDK